MTDPVCRNTRVVSEFGMHLRAAGVLVRLAERFESDIWIEHNGRLVNGKSVMSMLSLAAAKGAELSIWATGKDATQAAEALASLIEGGFEMPRIGERKGDE